MNLIIDLFGFFTEITSDNNIKVIETNENINANMSLNFDNFKKPNKNDITSIFEKFSKRDFISINIKTSETDDSITFNSNSLTKIDDFISDLNSLIKTSDEETITIYLNISKVVKDSVLSIYKLDKFIEFLSSKTLSQLSNIFNKLINNQYIKFESFDSQEISFNTSSIFFYNQNKSDQITIDSNILDKRSKLLEKQHSNCHFANASEYQLIPEDFYFRTESSIEELNNIFKKLSVSLSMIYIFDVTSIKAENDTFHFKLNGNKTITNQIPFKDFKTDCYKSYFEIYKWAYGDGSLSDKLGLARNIITLHIKNNNLFEISNNILSSIKSGYKIYLKQNVKQYIEVKNKISDYLFDFSQKANKIVDSFSDSFKKSSFAIFSLILARLFGKDKLSSFFTQDMVYVAYIFIGISFLYWFASIFELHNNKKRYLISYENIKQRYNDLLEPEDLNNIFNEDKDHKENLKFICKQGWIYSVAWLGSIIILLLFIYCSLNNSLKSNQETKSKKYDESIQQNNSAKNPNFKNKDKVK